MAAESFMSEQLARLDAAVGSSYWQDASQPYDQRLHDFVETHVRAGLGEEDLRANTRRHFPGVDPQQLETPFRRGQQERQLEEERKRASTKEESWSHYIGSRLPFASLGELPWQRQYANALARARSGTATPEDLRVIAERERLHQIEGSQTTSQAATNELTRIPAMIGEAAIGGPLLGRVGAFAGAGAAGRTLGSRALGLAASTAAMPSLYVNQAIERNVEQGRSATDLRGLPAAFTMAMAQNAVFGSLGQFGNSITSRGIRATAARLLANTAQGMGVQHFAIEPLAEAISTQLPDAYKLQTGHGLLANAFAGNWGEAWKQFAVSLTTFAAFSGLHELRGEHLLKSAEGAMKALTDQGLGREQIVHEMRRLTDNSIQDAEVVGQRPGNQPVDRRLTGYQEAVAPVVKLITDQSRPGNAPQGQQPGTPPAAPNASPERRSGVRTPQATWDAIKASHPGWTTEQIGREAARRADVFARDDLTGFQQPHARAPAAQEAIAAAGRGESAHYVEMDIHNLGGLNAARGHEGANKVYGEFAKIIHEEMHKLNADVQLFRHGGDEMSAVVIHGEHAKIEQALKSAQARIAHYVKAEGLADIAHPKHTPDKPRLPGTGIYYGMSKILGEDTPSIAFSRADKKLEQQKKDHYHVDRKQTEKAGYRPSEGTTPEPGNRLAGERGERTRTGERGETKEITGPKEIASPTQRLTETFDKAGLTKEERRTLLARAEGKTMQEIANKEGMSRNAINKREKNARAKLGLSASVEEVIRKPDKMANAAELRDLGATVEGPQGQGQTREGKKVDVADFKSHDEATDAMMKILAEEHATAPLTPEVLKEKLDELDKLVALAGKVGAYIEGTVRSRYPDLTKYLTPAEQKQLFSDIKDVANGDRTGKHIGAGVTAPFRRAFEQRLQEEAQRSQAAAQGEGRPEVQGAAASSGPAEAGGANPPNGPADAPAPGNTRTEQAGANKLNADEYVNPSFRDFFKSEQGFVDVEKIKDLAVSALRGLQINGKAFMDGIKQFLAPSARTSESAQAGGIFRETLAEMARRVAGAEKAMEAAKVYFDAHVAREPDWGKKVQKFTDFTDAIEEGKIHTLPRELRGFAETIREAIDNGTAALKSRNILSDYIENYFGHVWQKPGMTPGQIGEAFARGDVGPRPLAGKEGYKKARSIPTFSDGIDAGFTPITWNPAEMALLKLRELYKSVMAHDTREELEKAGLREYVRIGDKPPEGWTTSGDPKDTQFGAGLRMTGKYYHPETVTQLIDNYLSPGLWGRNKAYDVFREFGNFMNQFQLGFSLFHGGFVFMDTQVSQAALGVQLLSRWEVGLGIKTLIGAPFAPVKAWVQGSKMLSEYYKPGSQGAEMGTIMDAFEKGGGRAKMDTFYGGQHLERFRTALKDVQAGDLKRIGGVLYNALPALADVVSKPVMEQLVPRMKMGIFADMAMAQLDMMKNATDAQKREAYGKIWDSVENRLGQLTYDNLFWHRTFKDLVMAGVRSVGWNLGTARELGGGLLDAAKAPGSLARGEGVSPRLAYLVALPMVAGMYGAMYQKIATGKGPEEAKDYFFPKNGKTRRDGMPERMSLPSYLKDVAAVLNRADEGPWTVGQNIAKTAKGKIHPGVTTIADMLMNEDFFGAAIRNPNDPVMRQTMDAARFLLEQFQPMAFRAPRGREREAGDIAQGFFGITQAPFNVTHSWQQQRAIEAERRTTPTPLEQRRRRQ